MNDKKLKEKWEEIIATANDGDPRYSFELFKGLMSEKRCVFCGKYYILYKNINDHQIIFE